MHRIALALALSGAICWLRAEGHPVASPGADAVDVWTSELLELASRKAGEAERQLAASKPMMSSTITQRREAIESSPEIHWQGWLDYGAQPGDLKPLVRSLLRQQDLPEELLAVPLIESGFNRLAESPKGARGLWQLMPDTAKRFGLNTQPRFDERLDPVRSTLAAARYLKELHGRWNDWSLALAAYNAGEGAVQQAIAAGRSQNFWRLSALRLLPAETRAYVPAVFRAARQMAESGR